MSQGIKLKKLWHPTMRGYVPQHHEGDQIWFCFSKVVISSLTFCRRTKGYMIYLAALGLNCEDLTYNCFVNLKGA